MRPIVIFYSGIVLGYNKICSVNSGFKKVKNF